MSHRCKWILNDSGEAIPFSPADQERITQEVIEVMAGDGLRTIGLAYKRFSAGKSALAASLFHQRYLTFRAGH